MVQEPRERHPWEDFPPVNSTEPIHMEKLTHHVSITHTAPLPQPSQGIRPGDFLNSHNLQSFEPETPSLSGATGENKVCGAPWQLLFTVKAAISSTTRTSNSLRPHWTGLKRVAGAEYLLKYPQTRLSRQRLYLGEHGT